VRAEHRTTAAPAAAAAAAAVLLTSSANKQQQQLDSTPIGTHTPALLLSKRPPTALQQIASMRPIAAA
jgi:hypothetical protein